MVSLVEAIHRRRITGEGDIYHGMGAKRRIRCDGDKGRNALEKINVDSTRYFRKSADVRDATADKDFGSGNRV